MQRLPPSKVIREETLELDFLEALSSRLPEHRELLKTLGELYTAAERYEKGLQVDRKLIRLCPDDPSVWYNLACSLSLTRQIEEALQVLKTALKKGFSDYTLLSEDGDLDELRDDPRYERIMQQLKPVEQGAKYSHSSDLFKG